MEKIYYCENCGGVMDFDPASQMLKYPNCDTHIEIFNDNSLVIEHPLTLHDLHTVRADEKTSHTMECRGCGAKIEVDATSTATECPYCGSNYVLASKQEDAIVPDGIFTEEGSFDVESEIVPFLSSLKDFKFGFNSGIRAEVLFINTKEVLVKWGTKAPVLIPAAGLPGGMPIRAFGTFACKVSDYDVLIEKVAGIRQQFSVDDVKERMTSMLDQLLMKWITAKGKDMFNLQMSAGEIGRGILEDLDIQQASMVDAMSGGRAGAASDMAGMAMGMAMGQQMAAQMMGQPQPLGQSEPQMMGAQLGAGVPNFARIAEQRQTAESFVRIAAVSLYS